jgi:hypothetical protein
MSFKASLYIEDQEYRVLNCKYEISQSMDHKGKPASRPQGGRITVLVESDENSFLFDWSASETQIKNGSILFYKNDAMSKMKELKFTDAYCVNYVEEFTSEGTRPMQTEIVLSAKELNFGGSSKHANPWTKNGAR